MPVTLEERESVEVIRPADGVGCVWHLPAGLLMSVEYEALDGQDRPVSFGAGSSLRVLYGTNLSAEADLKIDGARARAYFPTPGLNTAVLAAVRSQFSGVASEVVTIRVRELRVVPVRSD